MSTMSQAPGDSVYFEGQNTQLESSRPVLNETLIEQYEAMDEGINDDPLLAKLFAIFQKSLPEHLNRLVVALQKQDETDVNYLIHKMLGMAHNVGALRLSEILMILEQSETTTRMRLDADDLALLNAEYRAAEAALKQHLNSRGH